MKCWQCGAEPEEVYEVVSMETQQPVRVVARWPTGDHEHAERPPTPEELAAAGSVALARITGEWSA